MATPIKFGIESLINTTTLNDQSNPTITALANGRFCMLIYIARTRQPRPARRKPARRLE